MYKRLNPGGPRTAIKIDAILQYHAIHIKHLSAAGLLDILGAGSLVLAGEVLGDVASDPDSQLGKLFTKTIRRLSIHVSLSNELWKGNLATVSHA